MSEQKSDRQWHAEQARAERKARLSRMKDKNGGKKPVRTGNPAFKIVGIILLVLAVLAAGGWYVLNSSLPQQTLAAMTINGDKIKVAELNYYFYMTASSYGIDMTDPKIAEASLATPSSVEGYATYRDLILEAAARQVQENYMLASEATKAGLSLDDSDRAKISEFYKTLQASRIRKYDPDQFHGQVFWQRCDSGNSDTGGRPPAAGSEICQTEKDGHSHQ